MVVLRYSFQIETMTDALTLPLAAHVTDTSNGPPQPATAAVSTDTKGPESSNSVVEAAGQVIEGVDWQLVAAVRGEQHMGRF